MQPSTWYDLLMARDYRGAYLRLAMMARESALANIALGNADKARIATLRVLFYETMAAR